MNISLPLSRVSLIFIVSIGLVLGIYWDSLPDKTIKNGFIRNFNGKQLDILYQLELPSNRYYFSGFIKNTLYLGIAENPFHLMEIQDTLQRALSIPSNNLDIRVSNIYVDSAHFIVSDLKAYVIYKGSIRTWTIQKPIHTKGYFTEIVPVGTHSLFLRTFNTEGTEHIIVKESHDPYTYLASNSILQKQIDGIFCTDGILNFNKQTNTLVYSYFYRNEFIHFDTAFSILNRSHTLDTTSQAAIKVADVAGDGTRSLASPPAMVNRRSFSEGAHLYINSTIIADNEESENFESNDVIDIYELMTGTYQSSFYLPHSNGVQLRHFTVHTNCFYVLHDRYLTVYNLR